jgi:hypothetical protein
MRRDPIVEEIHRIREAHARKFNYDLHAMFADIRRKQAGRKNLADLKPVKPALTSVAENGHLPNETTPGLKCRDAGTTVAGRGKEAISHDTHACHRI